MVKLKVKDLRCLAKHERSLLQAGQVLAVHQVEGQHRHARISLEAGRLFLHALKEQSLPQDVATLQVSEVVPPSPPCMVFLDLSWPGHAPRRVHIRLGSDTPRGRQFMLLCMGQCGPSYLNTKLFRVENKGEPGECVRGGDYESNDGTGTCQLLPFLDRGVYQESHWAGDVFAKRLGKGLFGILTRDHQAEEWGIDVFSEVVEGLHVVAEAALHSNIMEVTVVDCGVVLRG